MCRPVAWRGGSHRRANSRSWCFDSCGCRMSDRLTVWWNGRIAGSVRLDHHGDMTFAYSQTWLENADGSALSFLLPKREQPFGRRECQPFRSEGHKSELQSLMRNSYAGFCLKQKKNKAQN